MVYLVVGDLGEGIFLLCAAGLTIGLVVVQEARSETALKALRALAQPYARVIRDGVTQRIPARDIVPGDLVLVAEGERIPADAELVVAAMPKHRCLREQWSCAGPPAASCN